MARREWMAIYSVMSTKTKYRRLSVDARAALLHLFATAGWQTPEATWGVEELQDVLRLEGIDPAAVEELRTRRWLDTVGDGTVGLHDWDQHQEATTRTVRAEYEASRKREWRRRASSPSSSSPRPPLPPTSSTRQEEDKDRTLSPGPVPDVSGTNGSASALDALNNLDLTNPADLWEYLFGKPPTARQRDTFLSGWIDTEGREGTCRLLSEAHAARAAGDREARDHVAWIHARVTARKQERAERAGADLQRRKRHVEEEDEAGERRYREAVALWARRGRVDADFTFRREDPASIESYLKRGTHDRQDH